MEITCRDLFRGLVVVVIATAAGLTLPVSASARSQEPAESAESVVDAARNAREQASNSTVRPKVITNDDLVVLSSPPSASANPPKPSSESPSEHRTAERTPEPAGCHDPEEDDRLKQDLQATQEELDQIRRELSYDPKVISDGDVDMKNFTSGSSGLAFGSPPLSQAQPQAPARVTEVMLEQKIAAMKDASRIACDSPEDAEIQQKLDSANQQLKLLQSEFALDRAAYYSKPDYAGDSVGQAKLEAEQQQIESLQSEIERLKGELATGKAN
jgi:hypothetical protein